MDSTDRHRQVFRGLKDSTEVSHMDSHTHVLTKWISHARGNLGTRSLILLKDYVGVKKKKKTCASRFTNRVYGGLSLSHDQNSTRCPFCMFVLIKCATWAISTAV